MVASRRHGQATLPAGVPQHLGGPVQLHIGTNDEDVPVAFHTALAAQLRPLGKLGGNYVYPGDNHNLSGNLRVALNRSVQFFRERL